MPSSKSHTVRAVMFGLLAEGTSTIRDPLDSGDTRAAVDAAQGLGATVEIGDVWHVQGVAGKVQAPGDVIDVRNSGTTLYIAMSAAALCNAGWTVFTGDAQIRRRPADRLIEALKELGAQAFSTRGNGCAPLVVGGPLRGGRTMIECPTSQYLTSLLMSTPLAEADTDIAVPLLHEHPYVRMTLRWLDELGIQYEASESLDRFRIPAGQGYRAFDRQVPADFSSATFFLCAAAITDSDVLLQGLDMQDTQGDKAVIDYLRAMGASIEETPEGLRVRGGALHGADLDLNATPDALPAMAAAACYAKGVTRLQNVPQARQKETDRIAVMCQELGKLGARVRELPDGLEIEESPLQGGTARGHDDHRVVMALSLAGFAARRAVVVDSAEAIAVTVPDFADKMAALGARIQMREATA